MGLAPLKGGSGRGKGGNWGTIGRAEDQKGAWPGFPCPPAETPGLILCPPRPPPARWVLREWEGRGSKSKGQTSRTSTPRGGWGRGGVPTPSGTHPRLGVQWRRGRPWERRWGRGTKEWSQCLPCPLRHREACWALRPNPLPLEPPPCRAEPKPRPYTPTQGPNSTLGDPLQRAGPKPHPHTLTQRPTSKLGTPHS